MNFSPNSRYTISSLERDSTLLNCEVTLRILLPQLKLQGSFGWSDTNCWAFFKLMSNSSAND